MTISLPSALFIAMGLAALSALPYLPALSLPFISDDYIQIALARQYGPMESWPALLLDPLYRCRSTSLVLTWWTEKLFGLSPSLFTASSLVIHMVNTWLVAALGIWRPVGWHPAVVAAAFFAVHEGHQEAVIWYAALPELLVFLFGLLSFLFWVHWLQAPAPRRLHYAASLAAFLAALASKESAVALVPLMALAVYVRWREGTEPRISLRRLAVLLAPFALASAAYFLLAYFSRSNHLHFNDGSFSLGAPVWITWTNSYFRLLWIWGVAALAAAAAVRKWRPVLAVAPAWIGITLLPYCFLIYMNRVPSRHTYFASAGLALVFAAGWMALRDRLGVRRAWALPVLAGVVVLHNCGYVWTRKQTQFAERAAPTEDLVEFAQRVAGPVAVHCFPYSADIAVHTVAIKTGKDVDLRFWRKDPDEMTQAEAVFCSRQEGHQPLLPGVLQPASLPRRSDSGLQ